MIIMIVMEKQQLHVFLKKKAQSRMSEVISISIAVVRISLQTGPESEMDAPSFERTWLQCMCCALITPDVLICRKRKERFSRKGGNNRKRGWN
jgi:hypothetical protein